MEEFEKIVHYIAQNYRGSKKIVEIGLGETTKPSAKLRELLDDCKLIVTDLREPSTIPEGVEFIQDDVREGDLRIYKGADLIYSLRPPFELHEQILKIAQEASADLLLKPVSDEEVPKGGKLVNYQGASFYLYK